VPIFTYRCSQGHEWDEVRRIEGSQVSESPCPTCLQALDAHGIDLSFPGDEGHEDLSDFAGRRVPPATAPSVKFNGPGFTPKFYPNRKGK
jgi:hypothetical protein